MNIFLLGVVFS